MDLIAALEGHGRGVYSGTIGYVDAQGDWDFNVVIRSLMHRADTGRVDVTVGGALTRWPGRRRIRRVPAQGGGPQILP